ncbi:MAG: 23S rRNA (uracil(1939)-C(5))-methyltransferase RlmD [Lentimicrobiaceae bacterium]|jgi:23S rRNA (uracil1939-C5)-methyltransferase|nr:23S rRNA (uracil(1939)-C(5))-methyltransferase RlmD [Lentimicrobiaceae bacterium]
MKKPRRTPVFVENIEIVDAGSEGMAVAKPEGKVVFVPFAAPGDIVDLSFFKKKRNYFEGKIIEIKKYSDKRTAPVCSHFGLCGGCKWQHIDYKWQLFYKEKQVKDNFERIGKIDNPEISPILASDKRFYYRNKLEYSFSNRKWLTDKADAGTHSEDDVKGLGFHLPGMFDRILDIKHCYLQEEPSNRIRLFIKDYAIRNKLSFYNARAYEGLMRNMFIRSTSDEKFMLIIIFQYEDKEVINKLLTAVSEEFPEITSLLYAINNKKNDSVSDLPMHLFKGDPFIVEKMASPNPLHNNLEFRIGPLSFYQTNAKQAEKLYRTVFDFANPKETDLVYDLYTGTGTMALYFARFAKHIIGIEYVEEAIADAKENARMNHIANTTFIAGDMAKVLDDDFIEQHGVPDIIITDPPRAGMHRKVIEQLLKIKAKKMVYVSCNPATQARDLSLLYQQYKIKSVQPVDMFPHTQHVENVVLLELRSELLADE